MSIRVQNVIKIYGEQRALNDISFEVKPGEIVGFLGPNGAGKSTMMRIICGYIPQTNGTVEVCDMNVVDKEIPIKQKLGYLPENNPLYLEMYVKEYLKFIAEIYKVRNAGERIEEIIKMVGLTKEQHKKIGALSKGYRQRVGLAQAFIHNPEVLILDEPTTGLDPNQIVEIRELIKQIGKDKTVMLSTHIMQEVEAICDRAIIINEGEIVADKPIGELKKSAEVKESLQVEFAFDFDEKVFKSAFPREKIEVINNRVIHVTSENLSKVKKDIMKFAIDKEWEISNMSVSSGNLEEIFRKLTTKRSD